MSLNFFVMKFFVSLVLLLFIVAINGNSVVSSRRLLRRLQIKTADGDMIDCVDIYKQPALKHASMKNHTIQMRPSQFSSFEKQATSSTQLKERKQCPEGTIPILRTKNKKELYMNSAENDNMEVEYAVAYKNDRNDSYTGVSADIYVWHSHVEPNEYNMNMVGCEVLKGDEVLYAIYAGHGVFPEIYNDTKTRLFIGLSNGGSEACLNDGCPFVQVDNHIFPGSYYQANQFCRYGDPNNQPFMSVAVYRDLNVPKWWVSFDEKPIGYFAGEVVNILDCSSVLWGGMVFKHGGNPTPTQMGNGHFPNEGIAKTGAIDHALFNSKRKGGLSTGIPTGVYVTRPKCFDFKDLGRGYDKPGHLFLYGGPGSGSNTCT